MPIWDGKEKDDDMLDGYQNDEDEQRKKAMEEYLELCRGLNGISAQDFTVTVDDLFPTWTVMDPPKPRPSDTQIGGTHYRDMPIQPSEFNYVNGLNWLEGNAVKYICRHAVKGGVNDIDKAIHYLELLKEWEYESSEEANVSTPF